MFIIPRFFTKKLKIKSVIIAYIISASLAFFAVPAGAIIYSHGFEVALKNHVDLNRLQSWAQVAIAKYHRGELQISKQVERAGVSNWPVGKEKIAIDGIPDYLQKGIFKPSVWGPSIGICTIEGTVPCVAISWYLHGILVGHPNYETQWKPWYIKKIKPGIFIYYIEK